MPPGRAPATADPPSRRLRLASGRPRSGRGGAGTTRLTAVVELFGDSSREGAWAAARLWVDGSRIVGADAPGLERGLEGLTLLEAAAVGGETLAVDALANAIGGAVRAAPDPGRTAVAMSGGVDSAVALLAAGVNAVGVTLRLWVDPAAPDHERACCSPAAVIAARRTCHERGLPHVTLDLREEFRRTVVEPFTRAYARGATPNPCVRCNGSFRFDELLAFADRVGAGRLATGHYAQLVERAGRRAIARAVDARKDQSYMLATVDPSALGRLWFPLGGQTKEETRAQAAAAGLGTAGSAESQEACFLGGDDYRTFLGRHGLAPSTGPVLDESGRRLGSHEGFWRFTPGQRRGLGIAAPEPLYTLTHRRPDEHRRRRPESVARPDEDLGAGPPRRPGDAGSRRSSATARPRSRRPSPRPPAASSCASTSPRSASRPGRPPSSTRTTPSSAPASSRPRPPTKLAAMLASTSGDVARYLLAFFLLVVGLGLGWALLQLATTFRRSSAFIRGTQTELLPVIHKVGESLDRVNGQLDKLDVATDSAIDAVDAVDRRCARSAW